MSVTTVHAAPAKVIGEPRSLGALRQFLDAPEVIAVQGLCAAKVHGDTMLNDSILIEDLVKNLERASAVDHVVLRDDLKPIDDWLLRENVVVVRNSQTDPDSIVGVSVEAIGRHRRSDLGEEVQSAEGSCLYTQASHAGRDYFLEPSVAQAP